MTGNSVITNERNLFGDLIIYRTNDKFGDILVVEQSHFRNLTFDSRYYQSSMDLREPNSLVYEYTQAMVLALAYTKFRHVTLLGLGGGSILRSICEAFPGCKINAIELRQSVYEVAREFFGIPVNKNVTITISDAEQWLINAHDNSTDVILADMFTAYSVNPFQMQKNFIHQCVRVLSNNGLLVINYHEIPNLKSFFFEFLCNTFSSVFIYKTAVGNNNVVFASKDHVTTTPQIISAVLSLEKKLGNKSINFFNRLIRLTDK